MSEIQLHAAIKNLLDSIGIVAIHSATHKRSTNNTGTPDFLLAVKGQAAAFEVKSPKKKLRPEQDRMFERMTNARNGWKCFVVYSLQDAINALEKLGI